MPCAMNSFLPNLMNCVSNPSFTCIQLASCSHFPDEFGLELTMLSHGVSILYSFFQNKKKTKARMPMSMRQLVTEVTGKEVPPEQKYLIFEVMCSTDEEEEVDVPCLRLFLNAE
mmetsp:Transcript_15408/g.27190  ORF Transcript_15408/g.27190 Transcript_15408/m.27190 type:complete len:114 (-) Transcript_15408:174-515(-)